MADDKGTSQLFGESLPGTGGDYLDTNDVEAHMGNKQITPMPPSADGGDGGPEGIGAKGRGWTPEAGGDTEGHRKGPGGNIPNADGGDGSPDGNRGPGGHIPTVDGSEDVEGHRKGPGGNIPNLDAGPEGIGAKGRGWTPEADGSDDVEGHGFAKRAPGENPHGDR
jgi:hypothetical protein